MKKFIIIFSLLFFLAIPNHALCLRAQATCSTAFLATMIMELTNDPSASARVEETFYDFSYDSAMVTLHPNTLKRVARSFLKEEMGITSAIEVKTYKEGSFSHVLHCKYKEDDKEKTIAVDISLPNATAAKTCERDFLNRQHYQSVGLHKDSSQVFKGQWRNVFCVGIGNCDVFVFASEWLEGYDELRIIKCINGNNLIRWVIDPQGAENAVQSLIQIAADAQTEAEVIDALLKYQQKQYVKMSQEESDRVKVEMIKILTRYYDPEAATCLANVFINNGDFIYKLLPNGSIDVKLITIRWIKKNVPPKNFIEYLLNFSALDGESNLLSNGAVANSLIRTFSPKNILAGIGQIAAVKKTEAGIISLEPFTSRIRKTTAQAMQSCS